ncbi:MAG: serine hydrolase domain-containing protein, partial [Blastocatellia bacterium]
MRKTSKTTILASLALILQFAVPAYAQDTNPAAKIDEYLSTLAKQNRFMGSALVAREGKVVFSKGYGMANLEWDIPNTPQTRFRLGSVTKQFTAALIMQLVEQGKIKLDGKLSDY